MCLIVFAWRAHPRWPLVMIANRDEYHARPTAAADFLADAPEVFGGIDLRAGGSWLLVSKRRRLAAITNVRVGLTPETSPRSRGELVKAFAISDIGALAFIDTIAPHAHEYGRFNLLLWDGASMHSVGNYPDFHAEEVAPGLHALSNANLDEDWPKARRVKHALSAWMAEEAVFDGRPDTEPLFAALADTAPATDVELPDTGVGLELERLLSPVFVVGDTYGTRSSAVVLASCAGIEMSERRFGANQAFLGGGGFVQCAT